jgi:hypothetical protein
MQARKGGTQVPKVITSIRLHMPYLKSQRVATVASLVMVEKGWCSHLQLQTLVSPEVTVDLHTTNLEREMMVARKATKSTGCQQGQPRMLYESRG